MSGSMLRLRINSDSDVTRALIAASRFADEIGFSRTDCQGISTAVSELARNILKYASDGEILIERVGNDPRPGVQITARDRGPGIKDIEAAMSDHFSSSGTLGLGLPGVKRLMDEFEIDSSPGTGTRVIVRKWREARSQPVRSVLLDAARRARVQRRDAQTSSGAVSASKSAPAESTVDCAYFIRPCRGERVSGDMVVAEQRDDLVFLAVIDALGHGPSAHTIADRAAQNLRRSWKADLAQTMRELHECLRGTDGAAAGLCILDVERHAATYVGVGNTVIRTLGDGGKKAYSTPGTLGHQIRTPREQRLTIDRDEVLVLYSDGVKEQFQLTDYPQLRCHDARTIARTIVTRFGKDHDDASCAVLRYKS
jgi:anti-sigma regulatory factor (Ser/Thr protein kinase)/serine/threonine protein phosphatase PrpC